MSLPRTFYRAYSFNTEWEDLSASVDLAFREHEGKQVERRPTLERVYRAQDPVTNKHWVNTKLRSACSNTNCAKTFGLTDRKINCRRCGEVFCSTCTQQKLHLSPEAVPDYTGRAYKVCVLCYGDVSQQGRGALKTHTEVFKTLRKRHLDKREHHQREESILQECQRLTDGFKKCAASSAWKSTVDGIINTVKVQEWQKSEYWMDESVIKVCTLCYKNFGVMSRRIHCRVCGRIVCISCCNGDLLLYIQDGQAKWSIIKIIGCPASEPRVCLYLWVCITCHGKLTETQINNFWSEKQSDILDSTCQTYRTLMSKQEQLDKLLPKYSKLIEALESDNSQVNNLLPNGCTLTQTLAKYYTDISDLFCLYAVNLQAFKRNKPKTESQMLLLRNIAKSRCSFYSENLFQFRQWKSKLFEVLPVRVLESMQAIVDQVTMNSIYVVVRQLGMEALMLADKHSFDYTVVKLIANVEAECLDELKVCIQNGGQSWDEHAETLDKLLTVQLKEKRLVKPSKQRTQAEGGVYVEGFLVDRSIVNLRKVMRHLEAKSSIKQFPKSKGAIANALKTMSGMTNNNV